MATAAAPSPSAEILRRHGLEDVLVSDFLRSPFAFMVLEFDERLEFVSGACVLPKEGAGPAPCAAGLPLRRLLSPSDYEVAAPLIEDALAGRPGGLRMEFGEGDARRALKLSFLSRRRADALAGLVLTVEDVTARTAVMARMKALEDRLSAILTCAADAVVVIDTSGMIEDANAAAALLTGWDAEELVGRPVVQLMDEPYRSAHQGRIESYMDTGRSGILNVAPRVLPLLHKSGRTVPIELSVGEAFIAGERKFIGVCRDISARLQKDEALRAANAELRGKIAELERLSASLEAQKRALQELAQENAQARVQAEAANHAKSRFVATMSHELRTPLNGILAVADALSRRDLADADQELVEIIRSSGRGLLSILNEVLDLARVESGALRIEPSTFSPREVLDDVAEVWRFAAEAKGIALKVSGARLPDQVVGDAKRLRQVLSNLVNNAIKFTDRGEVRLSARPLPRSEVLRFEVSDSGPGIEPQDRERLFEPFVQADSERTRKHGGTGLGLAICREIVSLMGGRIWAQSAEGGGACIVVEIPFPRAGRTATAATAPAAPAAASFPAADDPLVLVAEDHPLNRLVASIILEEAGVRFEFAEDGEAAVEAVRSGRFDLVLMDVNMPRMDGLEATRRIRQLEGRAASVPIVAVTANASPEEQEICRRAGMDEFVSKPIAAEELLQTLARRLTKR